MIYRTYGQTGVEVSAIGFGGMRFQQDDPAGSAAVMKAAYDAGINYFDTAPGYGKSEDIFGMALKEMLPTREEKPFYVSTKSSKSKPSEIRRDLEKSLRRMGLDYVDFFHMWCVLTREDYESRKASKALQEFDRLKEEGLVKHVCVSTHLAGHDIDLLLRDYPFDGVLLGYSVMNFAYREGGLVAAADLGMGSVVMNPLGGGIIPQHTDRFDFVRTREDETVVEAALRFLLNDSRITVALVGLSTQEQLDEAVRAVDGYEPIASHDVRHIRSQLSDAFNEMCTGCAYCDDCPQGVPVPKLMEAYNHYLLNGNPQDALNRLRWHWGIGPDDDVLQACVECGLCEQACTQRLSICERLKELRAMAENMAQQTG